VRPRQVGVRDDEVVDAQLDDLSDAVVDRAVQAEALAPDHVGTFRLGPLGDLVVVAGHERRVRPHGREHTGRHPARELCALTAVERADEPALRRAEPLHGDEHGHLHWRRL